MVERNPSSIHCRGAFLYGSRAILPRLLALFAPIWPTARKDGSAPTLDEFLGLVQAWLSAYPQHYLDADGCVEDLGGRLFADALLAAASGGEFTTRWRAWSVDFDDE